MSGAILTLGGITLYRRESGTVGQARAVARLKRDFGVDVMAGGGSIEALIEAPGGVHALLACFCAGPVDEVDEDSLPLSELTAVLAGFFGTSGQPSSELPAGSPLESPSGGESPATS